MQRETLEQRKRGETGEWIPNSVLVNRLKNEYPKLTEEVVRVLTSRYINQAVSERYADKEKRGIFSFYRTTRKGRNWLIRNQDLIDDVIKWREEPIPLGLMSYAVAPRGTPIICENREEDVLRGIEDVDEFMKKIKEQNPDLKSLYLRFK